AYPRLSPSRDASFQQVLSRRWLRPELLRLVPFVSEQHYAAVLRLSERGLYRLGGGLPAGSLRARYPRLRDLLSSTDDLRHRMEKMMRQTITILATALLA